MFSCKHKFEGMHKLTRKNKKELVTPISTDDSDGAAVLITNAAKF